MLLWTVRQRNTCDGIICNDWKTVLFERGESETDCGEKKIAINSNKWWNSPTKKGFYVYLCSRFRNERLACEFRKTRDPWRKQLTSRSVSRSQWPMPCIGGRLLICSPVRLSPAIGVMSGAHYRRLLIFFMLYPRTHEVLGWIQGTRYAIKKRENRCPRNSRYSRDIENPNY